MGRGGAVVQFHGEGNPRPLFGEGGSLPASGRSSGVYAKDERRLRLETAPDVAPHIGVDARPTAAAAG